VTPPIWFDEHGQRQPTRRCWRCGSEVSVSRYRTETLRQLGWQLCRTQTMVRARAGIRAVPEADGYWRMVPVLGETA
jgi:hypothetical protein